MVLGRTVAWFRTETLSQTVEGKIDDRSRVQREKLADEQSANDRDSERAPQFRTGASTERQWNAAKERRHCRHHDRPKTQQARLKDRIDRRFAFFALRLEREVDHHDAVFLDDTDQ